MAAAAVESHLELVGGGGKTLSLFKLVRFEDFLKFFLL